MRVDPRGNFDETTRLEDCRFDRALILEDPDGIRLLYDAGRTVAGAEDPRLGRIDAMLVSHLHGNHVGDRRIARVNAGTCAEPETPVVTAPSTNSVEIALAKGGKIITGSEMPRLFAGKLRALGGDPSASHVNEAATQDGKVFPSTKTDTFIKASSVPVHLPLSGRSMAFDRDGNCVSGC
jgi:hypothetical protein